MPHIWVAELKDETIVDGGCKFYATSETKARGLIKERFPDQYQARKPTYKRVFISTKLEELCEWINQQL
jgi:hypothetical protein